MRGFKTGGRQKGTRNKSTTAIKELAAQYAPAAFAELARLATNAKSEAVRVAACREILDRTYGKAAQPARSDIRPREASDEIRLVMVDSGVPCSMPV